MTTLAAPELATASDVAETFVRSLKTAERRDAPYANWRLQDMLPEDVARQLVRLPFRAPDLGGVSGRRELHNAQRQYFAGPTLVADPLIRAVAEAFQRPDVVQAIVDVTGARLAGSYLRIEYAVDTEGFWLEPHTDLGVKTFTLLYQFGGPGQHDLGTDLYFAADAWAERVPFDWNGALVFVPSNDTWHGFEPRQIAGERRSLIINYVTDEWRAREQLAFPESPIGLG